jgi:hypothetical protein
MANAKYLRKRIALVAAAALGVGLLAAAPAFATTPAFTGGSVVTGTGATTSGVVTGVTETFGSVTRTGARTWTVPVTLGVTATGLDINTTYVVAGTVAAATGTATSASSALVGTFVSATSASIAGTITFTTPTSANYADVIAAVDTYAMTLNVNVNGTVVAASPVNSVTIPSVTATSFLTPIAQSYTSNSALTQVTGGIATLNFLSGSAAGTTYLVTSAGVGTIQSGVAGTTPPTNTNGVSPSGGLNWNPITDVQNLAVAIQSSVAGTTTVTFSPIDNGTGTPGTAITATVTWGAGVGTVLSSTIIDTLALNAPSTVTQEVSGVLLASGAAGIQAFSEHVKQVDANGNALSTAASAALTLSLSGVGSVQINTGGIAGYEVVAAGSANLGNSFDTVKVIGDGRAGVSTLTIAVNGVTVATKTLTFYGPVASITAVANKTVLAGAGASTLLAATVTAKDAAGTLVPNLTVGFSAVSSSASVLSGSNGFAEDALTPWTYGGHGNYTADVTAATMAVSGNTATITYTYTAGTLVVNAAPVTFTIGGAVATATLTLDKASYTPGAAAVLTVTVKDSAGNPAYSSAVVAIGGLVSNVAAQGLPNTAALTSKNGVATLSVYAPATAVETWTVTDALDFATVVSANATVTGVTGGGLSAADSAAIAAAKASADAATAAVAALSTTIASLIASITAQIRALSAQVAKLAGGKTPGLPSTGKKK